MTSLPYIRKKVKITAHIANYPAPGEDSYEEHEGYMLRDDYYPPFKFAVIKARFGEGTGQWAVTELMSGKRITAHQRTIRDAVGISLRKLQSHSPEYVGALIAKHMGFANG